MGQLLNNLRAQWDKTSAQMNAITEVAAGQNRDLNDVERANFDALKTELDSIHPRIEQLVEVERAQDSTAALFASVTSDGRETLARAQAPAVLAHYDSPGAYFYDVFRAFGPGSDLEARQRIQRAAMVNRTSINGATVADLTLDDIIGVVPEPIIGEVWSNVDAMRPVVATLVQRALTAPLMFRPKVVQNTQVGPQGTAGKLGSVKTTGAAVDEKKAFVSREMKLARIDIEPVAMGGVVDVSLWAEMLSPGTLDMIISDLADQYAIATEAYACAEIERAGTASKIATAAVSAETINASIYSAAAKVYGLIGRMPTNVGLSVDMWAKIGGLTDASHRPLFPALAPSNASGQSQADSFTGSVDGLPRVVSPGFSDATVVVYCGRGIEAFERRLGVLQAVEPERAGRVVSYSGLFTTVAMDDGAAVSIPQA
jgi:hypothetical protein